MHKIGDNVILVTGEEGTIYNVLGWRKGNAYSIFVRNSGYRHFVPEYLIRSA